MTPDRLSAPRRHAATRLPRRTKRRHSSDAPIFVQMADWPRATRETGNMTINFNQHNNVTYNQVDAGPNASRHTTAARSEPSRVHPQRSAGHPPSSDFVARLVPHDQRGLRAIPPFTRQEDRDEAAREFAEMDCKENRAAAKSLAGRVACGLFDHYFPHDALPSSDIEQVLETRPLEANVALHSVADDGDLMYDIARLVIASRECRAGTRWATIFSKIQNMQLDVVREAILMLSAERSQQVLAEFVDESGRVINADKLDQRLRAMLCIVSRYGSETALKAFVEERYHR